MTALWPAAGTASTTTDGVLVVGPGEHRALSVCVLTVLGTPESAAGEQADMLLEGDLRGHPSHGLRRLDMLVQRIRAGVVRPAAEPTLDWATQAVLRVGGGHGLGPPTAHRAVEALLTRVRETGVAVAAIRDSNHLGMLAPYVERMAADGIIGIATTTSEALVHPWGGRRAMVGTNPIALAIPTPSEPLVLDMATGQISMGKVLSHAARRVPLPAGAAVDEHGDPTTDAAAAAKGAISPFGGPKGYALAVTLELLVASLTGSALGRHVHGTLDPADVCNKGDVIIALAPEVFGAGASAAVQEYLDDLRAEPPAPGHLSVAVPGDRARSTRRRHLATGVPVAKVTWQRATSLADELRVCGGNGSAARSTAAAPGNAAAAVERNGS